MQFFGEYIGVGCECNHTRARGDDPPLPHHAAVERPLRGGPRKRRGGEGGGKRLRGGGGLRVEGARAEAEKGLRGGVEWVGSWDE